MRDGHHRLLFLLIESEEYFRRIWSGTSTIRERNAKIISRSKSSTIFVFVQQWLEDIMSQ